jgi:MFS-type transporter involved in bile tolerance (Atg22 family)
MWAESIPAPRLERYNCFSELSIQLSMIIGPLIASFFIAREQIKLGFSLDALTFFICALSFLIIISERKKSSATSPTIKRDIFKGFRLIAKNSELLRYVIYDAIQMVGFGAFNAMFLVLAQKDFNWTKAEYSYHLSIIAIFAVLGAMLGSMKCVLRINVQARLIGCAILSALSLILVLHLQSFPLSSILFGICDGLAVITMIVTRTKAQLLARSIHPDFISSILAARSIIIKAATLLGTGSCVIVDDYLSLQMTLALYVIPIGLSFLPFVLKQRARTIRAI